MLSRLQSQCLVTIVYFSVTSQFCVGQRGHSAPCTYSRILILSIPGCSLLGPWGPCYSMSCGKRARIMHRKEGHHKGFVCSRGGRGAHPLCSYSRDSPATLSMVEAVGCGLAFDARRRWGGQISSRVNGFCWSSKTLTTVPGT